MKPLLWKLGKILVFGALSIIFFAFAIYSAAWFSITKRAEQILEVAWQYPELTISGSVPRFEHFPYPPEARFSGIIQHQNGLKIETPLLIYSGFPVTSQVQYFEAPKGINITADFLERPLNIEFLALQARLPFKLPQDMSRENLATWQDSGESFTIERIVLKAGKISADGYGTLSLDNDLQPIADINARITGMGTLLDQLAEENGEKSVGIARSFYKMMSQIDPKTGEEYFETTLKIQKSAVYFGPMRITGLPLFKWN